MSEQALRELLCLMHPAFVQRHVRSLQNPRCVAVSLTMTHEQDRHAAWLAAFVSADEFRMTFDAAFVPAFPFDELHLVAAFQHSLSEEG